MATAAQDPNARSGSPQEAVGCVVIGRNEGARLSRCLESLSGRVASIIYVDSGSTDDSLERARTLDVDVVELDTSTPFTAARARNLGFERLRELQPRLEFVQFVDGDCMVVADWLKQAAAYLYANPDVSVVCGRRREVHPDRSIYNRLCDIEWDTPVGTTRACGGDAMMRCAAFERVGGFNPALVAGEEPELCVRLRQAGGRIVRLPHEMTRHDADMHHFGQWWRRNVRSGHAFAEGAHLHGTTDGHFVRELCRTIFWGGCWPASIAVTLVPTLGASAFGFAAYGVIAARAYTSTRARGTPPEDAALYALSCTLGKIPEMQGVLQYQWRRLRNQPATLIEYKAPNQSPGR